MIAFYPVYLQAINKINYSQMNSSNANYVEPLFMERFEFLKKVGSGAYGNVWKVRQRSSHKIYALKKIFEAFQNGTDAQRTFREIEILKQTDHMNIIKLHQSHLGKNGKDVYLLFDYLQADLHTVLHQGILKDAHMVFIFYQIARALKYLHSGMLIHRDLKPANILVNQNCMIKLCDFGLVKCLPKAVQLQKHNLMTEAVATRWYRAPQVLLGSKSYSEPADVWSFGCIIYEVLMKKPMFPGSDVADQIQKIMEFTGFPSQEDIRSLDTELANTIIKEMKQIKKNPQKQLQFIKEDIKDLLLNCIKFNPQKRFTIQQVLAHRAFSKFRRSSTETVRDTPFKTSTDDFTKLSIEKYKVLIQELCKQKQFTQKRLQINSSKINSQVVLVHPQNIQPKKELIPKMKGKNDLSLIKTSSSQFLSSSASNSKVLNINRSQKKEKPASQHKMFQRSRTIDPKSQKTNQFYSYTPTNCTIFVSNYCKPHSINKISFQSCKLDNSNPQVTKYVKNSSASAKYIKKIAQNGYIEKGYMRSYQQKPKDFFNEKVNQLKKMRVSQTGKWIWNYNPVRQMENINKLKRAGDYLNQTQPSMNQGSLN